MKTKNSVKRILSMLLVFALVLTTGFTGTGNFGGAADVYADSIPTATVTIASQAEGTFLHGIKTVAVSANLAESYGYTDNIPTTSVSALDVLVKAHQIALEDAFDETCLTISDGWVTLAFGGLMPHFSFFVNGHTPVDVNTGSGTTVDNAVVNDGDLVEFYSPEDSLWHDRFALFTQNGQEVRNYYALTNENITLSLKGYDFAWGGSNENLNGACIYTIDPDTGVTTVLPGKVTDANGDVTLSFDAAGTYFITIDPAYTFSTVPVSMPVLKIVVSDTSSAVANNVIVTIAGSDDTSIFSGMQHSVILQELNVNSFNARPFITTNAALYQPSAEVKTLNALIEAVYYSLYGSDPTPTDLNVTADSEVARNIRAHLGLSIGDWGVSQDSIYGKSDYQMSYINNVMGSGIGVQTIANGDKVEFCSWLANYSYVDVLMATPTIEWGCYPNVHLKVRQNYSGWTDSGVVEGSEFTKLNDSWGTLYGTTNANGITEFDVTESTDAGIHSFIMKGTSAANIPVYLKVSYSFNNSANTISGLTVSEVVHADTSLDEFTVGGIDAKSYQANNRTLDLVSTANSAPFTVTLTDNAATISGSAVFVNGVQRATFENAAGGTVTLPLTNGENRITFTVCNSGDSESYTVAVLKSNNRADNAAAVTRVINGIADYSGYTDGVFDYNWILAKKNAGKTITTAEREAFLTKTLSAVNNGSLDGAANAGVAAKTAIALSALNIDATRVPKTLDNTEVSIVAKAFGSDASSISEYNLPYLLMLHDLGIYNCTNSNCTREKVIEAIINKYSYDYGYSGWSATNSQGTDGSAMMIPALAPYYKAAQRSEGVNGISAASCAAIKGLVDADIEFYSTTAQRTDNSTVADNCESTAKVISALASLGINANTNDDYIKNGKSLIDGLLMFESADHRLGHTSNTYNAMASWQGLEALGNYRDMLAGGDGNNYAFTASVAPYTAWPDANLLTDILVTAPTKTTYNAGETLDLTGMEVKAVYNGDSSNAQVLASGYTVSPANDAVLNTVGVNRVTVTYNGIEKTFNVIVNADASTPYQASKVNVKVQSTSGIIAQASDLVITDGTTVLDVLKTVLNNAGKTCVIKNGGYVASIDGLGEFDGGPNSGWMFNVNNVTPQIPASDYELNNGDTVLWYYTLDYTKDSRNTGMKPGEDTTNEKTATTNVETTATVTDGKATASVSASDVAKAIEKVNEQVKTDTTGKTTEKEVVLEVKSTGNVDAVETTIPANAVNELAKADANVVVKTECGDIEIPADSMDNIATQAAGQELSITMENKKASEVVAAVGADKIKEETGLEGKALENVSIVEVTIKAGEKTVTSFGGKKISLSLPAENGQVAGKNYKVLAISADGTMELMTGVCVVENGKKVVKVTSAHLTTFVVTGEEVNNPFKDVSASDYFFDPVLWAVEKNVTSGKTEDTFAPFDGCTRAQMVTFLWRAAGSPWASANAHFSDVAEGAYYADAVEWAIAAGITKGVSETKFNPDGSVTREQLAAFIYRYAQDKGQGFTGAWMFLLDYDDASQVSEWADEAMHWCVMNNIVTGTTAKTLSPAGEANRAQIVTMLYRYFNL